VNTMTRSAIARQVSQRVRANFTIRRLFTIALLTAAWCGLWQDVSAANVIGGIVLAFAVLGLGVGTSGKVGVRPVPLLRLLGVVFVDLVTSTFDVAKEILRPADLTNESIIAVTVPDHARHHFLLLIVAITLTPGTAVVDADPDTGTMYLHLLQHERADEVRAHVDQLAELAHAALPTTTLPIGVAPAKALDKTGGHP